MFIEKTLSEYGKLVENFEFFNKFDEYSEFILNDERLLPLKTIWEKLETYIKKHYIKEYNFIHGDLCFSNILYGVHPSNEDVILKFIDPRGVFGKTAFYGDFYYDLAKLSHSCNGGYEYFIYDKFNIDTNKNIFTLSYENNNKEMVYEKFLKTLDEYSNINRTKIKLVEGLIFIGMCARHYDSLERQKAMFITGLKLLNEVYEEI
jgi:thiamine kinase-like enzyme